MEESTWIDCSLCDYFRLENGRQACDQFDIIGLPDLFREGTSRKCCSSFKSSDNLRTPDLTQMNYGVLYFYDPQTPDRLFEDIDL
jgi:hypothetical protein